MESFCRLCCISHKVSKLNDLFEERNTHLSEKLNNFACSALNLDGKDTLYICIRCTELLEAAYEFKLICESAEARFLAQPINPTVKEEVVCNSKVEIVSEENRNESLEFLGASTDFHWISEAKNKIDGDIEATKLYLDMRGDKTNKTEQMKVHRTSEATSNPSPGYKKRSRKRQVEDPASCDICKKTFSQKKYLREHMANVHIKSRNARSTCKQWICETCGREYKSKHTLNYHINGRHVETVVKNYACDLCDYKCREPRSLVSHQLVHSREKQYQCSECGKSFGFQPSLTRHILCVHKREKRHKCTICDHSFFTTVRLKEHLLVHTGEHPLSCTLCSRTYRYKNSLLKHMRKRHKDTRKQTKEIPEGI